MTIITDARRWARCIASFPLWLCLNSLAWACYYYGENCECVWYEPYAHGRLITTHSAPRFIYVYIQVGHNVTVYSNMTKLIKKSLVNMNHTSRGGLICVRVHNSNEKAGYVNRCNNSWVCSPAVHYSFDGLQITFTHLNFGYYISNEYHHCCKAYKK